MLQNITMILDLLVKLQVVLLKALTALCSQKSIKGVCTFTLPFKKVQEEVTKNSLLIYVKEVN